ncbi:hypothetical protein [Nocardia brevicatena]|uniref:hypothetical protein n=1 Tax=Nocardia brevicatena TaxID=37327 RepID=UPI0005947CBC|nr:hypothetical protein [Nocardia brevicatena]
MTDDDLVPALAYLRTDLTGCAEFDTRRIERLALRLGYELCETLCAAGGLSGVADLEERIRHHEAEAVFAPSADHLEGYLDRIVKQADVLELDGECHARWNPIAEIMGSAILTRNHRAEPFGRSGRAGVMDNSPAASDSLSGQVPCPDQPYRPDTEHRQIDE